MYAFIVKNENNLWDVWETLTDIPIPERKARVDQALESGLPIIGKNLTEYGLSARSGSVWNGTEWTGGDSTTRTADSLLNLYAYICNDTIILIHLGQPNSELNNKLNAVFESDNTIIKIPEGTVVKVGDIFDGQNFFSAV